MVKQIQSTYSVNWHQKIAEVPQSAWDALAQPLKTPFFEWDWLHDLESSGSITAQNGWLPNHLTVWREGTLIAAAPLYLKGHSYGEFVFDHQWADLANRLGIQYYPKLVGMSPVTPAEGYRFLIAPGEDEIEITAIMVGQINRFCETNRLSGCHFLYVDPQWQSVMENCGFTAWINHSYVWQNSEFQTFDDYLAVFNANQRRNIKRERKAVSQAGLVLKTHFDEDIPESLFSLMYDFYSDTCDKFGWWGSKYLNRAFFEKLADNYSRRVLFVAAYQETAPQKPIGMSFCITKGDRLYGRYWGCDREFDCLHFDACYYTPIEWAINRKIQVFDPGAGGRHKKRRGFPATPNRSLHKFYDRKFAQILLPYIKQINGMERQEIEALNEQIPFKEGVKGEG
jgi:uncharacterized protein